MRYRSAAAFRTALEERLSASTEGRAQSVLRLRKLVTFERFVARVQAGGDLRWLLKGGFALQLRIPDRARTTKDVDLGADIGVLGKAFLSPQEAGDMLADAATRDLGDFFNFEIGSSRHISLRVGPVCAYRYAVNAVLAGRTFERFHLDAGIGDPVVAPPVELFSSGYLDFAELPPVRFRAISQQQQFAEKVHALTLPRAGQENSRSRDLADLMLLLDLGLPCERAMRDVISKVFEARGTHPVPRALDHPPPSWTPEYEAIAAELRLAHGTLDQALDRLNSYWKELGWEDE